MRFFRPTLSLLLMFIVVTSISSEPFHKGHGEDESIYVKPNAPEPEDSDAIVLPLSTKDIQKEKLAASPEEEILEKSTTTRKPIQKTTKKSRKVKADTSPSVPPLETTTVINPSEGTGDKSKASSTSTPAPSTTVKPTQKLKPVEEEGYCLCDVHRHACDMNCCCDLECTEEDRQFFTSCEDKDQTEINSEKSSPRRQRACYKSFVTYSMNYEIQNVERKDDGMLCILRDNNKADNILDNIKINEIIDRITKGQLNITDKYSLSFNTLRGMQYSFEQYKYGSPILGVKSEEVLKRNVSQVFAYGFPASYHSAPCINTREPVKFLQPFHSQCLILPPTSEKECLSPILNVNSYLENMQILSNPGDEESPLVKINTKRLCNQELCSISHEAPSLSQIISYPPPKYNPTKSLCQNALVSLNLTFFFGLEGISEIIARAHLQDFPIPRKSQKSEKFQILQQFRTTFKWNSESENETTINATLGQQDWPRSGNPGYLVGKPVISGEKVKVREQVLKNPGSTSSPNPIEATEEVSEIEKEMVLVWKDPNRWISIHLPGNCPEFLDSKPENSLRKSILFDYSHSSTCHVNLTQALTTFKYCEDLQIHVAKILLGVSDPLTFDKRAWQVAAFGNSSPEEASEWVPLTYTNFPVPIPPNMNSNSKTLISRGCDSIVSNLHISLAYSFVGSVDFPQARITGVYYQLGDPDSLCPDLLNEDMKNTKNSKNSNVLKVTTTVSFKDVTAPPIIRVPRWPVLSIRLPKDFFYPFST